MISTATVIFMALASPTKTRQHWMPVVKAAANHYQIDWLLLDSLIWAESYWDPYAVSPVGAEGLTQLMPDTAKMLGVSNSFDGGQAIWGAALYIRQLHNEFEDWELALAAYNAGPTRVGLCKCIPPFKETQNYVVKIMNKWQKLSARYSFK
jgi:soluble lytic murein transglycosylase-like protein